MSVLQKGGNAFDAAIATAAVLGVVEPLMSGIGGDGFIMAYRARDPVAGHDSLRVCNGTGAAPYAATLERYRDGIPMKGILSVSVPGLLNAWLDTHEAYGSLPLSDVLAPAIALADDGFPVTHYLSGAIAGDALLCEFPTSRAIFTRSDTGEPLRPGDILRQSDLARTLSTIAEQGRDAFYRGSVGEAIVRFSEEQGGLLTMADFNDCSARWQDPISTDYGDYTVYEAPPNSSGHVLLQELNVIRQYDMASLGFGSPESIHLMVEAKKMAFADREAYVADSRLHRRAHCRNVVGRIRAGNAPRLIDWQVGVGSHGSRRSLAIPGRTSAGHPRRSRPPRPPQRGRRYHLLCRRRPGRQRRMPAPEHPERLGIVAGGRQHRHPAQQPHDLLAP